MVTSSGSYNVFSNHAFLDLFISSWSLIARGIRMDATAYALLVLPPLTSFATR
jgi:hypothetical protein